MRAPKPARSVGKNLSVAYYSQLYTRYDSGISTLSGAAGSSIGYGTTFSTSNFLLPAQLLLSDGVHPTLGFKRIEFLQGHDTVARAVYWGKILVGAGHDGVIVDLAAQPGFEDAKDKLVQLKRSPPIPSDPVVVKGSNMKIIA